MKPLLLILTITTASLTQASTCQERYNDATAMLKLFILTGALTDPEAIERVEAQYLALYLDCRAQEKSHGRTNDAK